MIRSLMVLMISVIGVVPAAAQRPGPGGPGDGPVIVTTGEAVVKTAARSRVRVDLAPSRGRRQPAGGAEGERRRDDGRPGQVEVRRSRRPTPSRRAVTTCSRSSTTRTASRRCATTSRATRSRCGSTNLPKVGEILDLAVGAGATSVTGVRFDLKDRSGAEREALKRAVEDARAPGQAAARAPACQGRADAPDRGAARRRLMAPPPMMMAMRDGDGRNGADADRRRGARSPRDGDDDAGHPLSQRRPSVLDDDALHRVVVEEPDQFRRAERRAV